MTHWKSLQLSNIYLTVNSTNAQRSLAMVNHEALLRIKNAQYGTKLYPVALKITIFSMCK
jgi:hypothetical protein